MDKLQKSIYTDRFLLAYRSLKGIAFQDWFVRLAGYSFGADFEEIRSYGRYGDKKCDGFRVSSGTVFQCYAPYETKEAELIAKVAEDFNGALLHWGDDMREWIFVHNDSRGLPPNAVQQVKKLREMHAPLKIAIWSEPELFDLFNGLDSSKLLVLFGPAASIATIDRLVMPDLVPIIEALAQREPDVNDPPLTPPSPGKLARNALSTESDLFLQMGRRKSALVETYFRKSPRAELGERIAEAFRKRYAELKAFDLPVEEIFKHLQEYAGFGGEPRQQGAALAVLAYFFDSCDIFEDSTDAPEPS